MIYTVHEIQQSLEVKEFNGIWLPCRPANPFSWHNIKGAWMVLTGKADALVWGGGQ